VSSDPQPLSIEQRAVLDFLLVKDFKGRDELAAQAETVRTSGSSCDCGCPSFSLDPDRTLPAAVVDDTVPVEAHGPARDGSPIGVLLFVRDGYLDELEIFGYAETPPPELPDTQRLALSQWSDPNGGGVRILLNPS
jgi:hypothetical protein